MVGGWGWLASLLVRASKLVVVLHSPGLHAHILASRSQRGVVDPGH